MRRIQELEQALNGLRSDYDLNNCRANKYQRALERIIYGADEYDGSPANELVDIASEALGGG